MPKKATKDKSVKACGRGGSMKKGGMVKAGRGSAMPMQAKGIGGDILGGIGGHFLGENGRDIGRGIGNALGSLFGLKRGGPARPSVF